MHRYAIAQSQYEHGSMKRHSTHRHPSASKYHRVSSLQSPRQHAAHPHTAHMRHRIQRKASVRPQASTVPPPSCILGDNQ